MTAVRSWRRRPLAWALVALLVLGGGLFGARRAWGACWPVKPHDARAYRQYDCSHLGGPRNLPTLLRYYGLTLPKGAEGVRYYSDDGSAAGPDVFFLRFALPTADAEGFVAALHASPSGVGPETALRDTRELRRRDGVDWTFPAGLPHRVLNFSPAGTAVLTPEDSRTVVRVVVSRS